MITNSIAVGILLNVSKQISVVDNELPDTEVVGRQKTTKRRNDDPVVGRVYS